MEFGLIVDGFSLRNEMLVKFFKYFLKLLLLSFKDLKNMFGLLTNSVYKRADLHLRFIFV